MAAISSAGFGSGLDVPGLVEKLVNAEGDPIRTRLDRKEAKLQEGLSAIGTLKGTMSEFQSALKGFQKMESLQSMSATSDDEGVVTVSASNLAEEGEYEIEVDELAQSQQLISVGFESDFIPLGSGALRIQFGKHDEDEETFTPNPQHEVHVIEIDDARSSLRDIQKSINEAKIGLKATIIQDDDKYRLILNSEHTGAENSIRISVQDDDGDNMDLVSLSMLSFDPIHPDGKGRNMVESRAAMDAELSVDGLDMTSASNEVTEVIKGVTLTLKDTGSADIEVKLNQLQVVDKIKAFVDGHNKLIEAVEKLAGFNPETRIAGPLNGDATVRAVINQVRRAVSMSFANVNKKYQSLAGVGITTDAVSGKLSVNESKLQRAINDDIKEVINLFSKIGRTDDPQINYLGAGDKAQSGTYPIDVLQKPTKGGYAAVRLGRNSFPIYIDESNDEFILKVDGIKTGTIKLDPGNYFSGHEMAEAIQEKVNQDANLVQKGAKIWTSYYDRRLILVSERLGAGSTIEMVSADVDLIEDLGMTPGMGQPGKDIKGSIGSFGTLGEGNVLTGKGDIEGLKVEFMGGEPGRRGKVVYSTGVAVVLDELINSYLESKGTMDARTEGYNARLSDIDQQRHQLQRKLDKSEERYLKQFTELDGLIGKMNSTGQFLSGQLAGLPGARRPRG